MLDQDLKNIFIIHDKDEDGYISVSQFTHILKDIGIEANLESIKQKLKELEPNNPNSINIKTFKILITELTKINTDHNTLKSSFDFLDKKGEGKIQTNEFKHILKNLGEILKEDEINNFINMIDKDSTGYINIQDAIKILTTSD